MIGVLLLLLIMIVQFWLLDVKVKFKSLILIRNNEVNLTFNEHGDNVNTLNFMKRSDEFILGSDDNSIILWKKNQNNSWIFQQKLIGHMGNIRCLILNNDDYLVESGSHDNSIKIWLKQNKWQCS